MSTTIDPTSSSLGVAPTASTAALAPSAAAGVAQTQPVVSVASNSSSGAAGGSVIDVSNLVSELVAATEDPQQTLINNQTQQVTSQISALGTLKGALSTFQSALSALDTPTAFQLETANSGAPDIFTATASNGAPAGTYNVAVTALASAQQLLSNAVSGSTIGTGTLQLSLGGTSFSVTVNSSNDTLEGLAAAINSAAGNPGIGATVLQGADGSYLLLSSSQTGAANTIQVTETDGGNGLAAFTYGSGSTNYTQEAAAQDAAFSISGVNFTSPSNTVTSAMNGVTLTLLGLSPTSGTPPTATPATLSIANDTTTITSNIQSFVTAYNTLQSTLVQLGGFDSSTDTAGPMMDDPGLENIQSQIQQALYSIVDTGSTTYNTLASVGITTNSDGSLSLNSATLSAALNSNFSAVSQLFSSSSGVAASLNSDINNVLGPNGAVTTEGQTLTAQENSLTQQSQQLQTQMAALSASMTQQYSALNALLSSLQSTSSYLTQAFASLPQVQGTPNA
ncbi:MAG TPA: flagellar filament capping protein FliD [Steroidobacteraceae bacterium]|nr:flagellar filament capping protein FliD [Steroidobacteraceae bacterium]